MLRSVVEKKMLASRAKMRYEFNKARCAVEHLSPDGDTTMAPLVKYLTGLAAGQERSFKLSEASETLPLILKLAKRIGEGDDRIMLMGVFKRMLEIQAKLAGEFIEHAYSMAVKKTEENETPESEPTVTPMPMLAPKPAPEPEPMPVPKPEPETKPVTEPKAETGMETGMEPEVEPEVEAESEAETEPETESESEPESETEPVPVL